MDLKQQCFIFTMTVVIAFTTASPQVMRIGDGIIGRSNYGAIFKKASDFQTSSTNWMHHFVISLPDINDLSPIMDQADREVRKKDKLGQPHVPDAKDNATGLSLNKVAEAAKRNEMVFTALSEGIVAGLISLDRVWPDVSGILALASCSGVVIMAIAMAFHVRHSRKLAVALLTLQTQVEESYANVIHMMNTTDTPLPTTIIHAQTTTIEHCDCTKLTILATLIGIGVIVIVALSFYLGVKWSGIFNHSKTRITLEMRKGFRAISVPVATLSGGTPRWNLVNDGQRLQFTFIDGFFYPRLHIEWKGYALCDSSLYNEVIDFDTEYFYLSPIQAYTIRRMMRTPQVKITYTFLKDSGELRSEMGEGTPNPYNVYRKSAPVSAKNKHAKKHTRVKSYFSMSDSE